MAPLKSGGRNSFVWMNSSDGTWRRFKDPREVISDPHARYYGIEVSERTLVPDNDARLGETRFEDWLTQATKQVPKAGRQPA